MSSYYHKLFLIYTHFYSFIRNYICKRGSILVILRYFLFFLVFSQFYHFPPKNTAFSYFDGYVFFAAIKHEKTAVIKRRFPQRTYPLFFDFFAPLSSHATQVGQAMQMVE